MTRRADDDRAVTVCSKCLRASCFQGEFFCEEYRSASTVGRTVAELRAAAREHPDYWTEQPT